MCKEGFMKYLVALFLFISSPGFAFKCGDDPFSYTTKPNGNKIGLFANAKDFENTPKWDMHNAEPPLSISSAVSLAKEWADSFYTGFDSVKIKTIRIQEYGCWDAKGNWFYVIDFTPIIDGNKLYGSGYMVAITMAGKILEPREYNK